MRIDLSSPRQAISALVAFVSLAVVVAGAVSPAVSGASMSATAKPHGRAGALGPQDLPGLPDGRPPGSAPGRSVISDHEQAAGPNTAEWITAGATVLAALAAVVALGGAWRTLKDNRDIDRRRVTHESVARLDELCHGRGGGRGVGGGDIGRQIEVGGAH